MTATDTLLRNALEKAKPLLDRFGILGAPGRAALDARRALTIDRDPDEVRTVLADPDLGVLWFARPVSIEDEAARSITMAGGSSPVVWRFADGGRARAAIRAAAPGTEVVMEVHLAKLADGARPRYADNAGVIAIRALHRAKSRLETGEVPSLKANPAARPDPDPYGD